MMLSRAIAMLWVFGIASLSHGAEKVSMQPTPKRWHPASGGRRRKRRRAPGLRVESESRRKAGRRQPRLCAQGAGPERVLETYRCEQCCAQRLSPGPV